MNDFVLAITPDEAAVLVPNWPTNAWLLAFEVKGERRWEVALETDLPNVIGSLPVWPPLPGFPVADILAEDEISLLRHVATLPGLAEAAWDRMLAVPEREEEPFIEADSIEWDEEAAA